MKIREWDINLKVRLIGELLMNVLFWMYFPFMAIYFADEFGKALTGWLMILPPVAGVISNLYGGAWADRFGRKRMMMISVVLEAIGLYIFAISPSPWLDFVIFVLLASVGTLYQPASMAMVADLVPVHERRAVFSVFYMANNIGVVLGPIIGSILFFTYRHELILGSAILSTIFLFVLNKYVHETLPANAKDKLENTSLTDQLKDYAIIFKDKLFFMYIIAGITISQIFMQMDLYMAIFVNEHVVQQPFLQWGDHLITIDGKGLYGWMIAVNGAMVVLFTVAVTRAIQRWSDKKALVISSFLFGFSFFMMAFSINPWYLLFCMVVFTLAELIRTPVMQNFITKISPEDQRGQYLGASSLQFSIGRAIAPLAITLAEFISPFGMFTLFFVLGIISSILYARMFDLHDVRVEGERAI
ncbi:MDR family MFS transporter [Rubeoparvulum massiliense]|uniref:MDR family MFS transporter n=1 Tax=Rubeoparvulum massiliense TaxID=1631346 RepID=UPI00065E7AD2|nr:MFS transporter [Rubeoparvulum massiliense]